MSKAKIGVIGAGWWATEFHIPNLKKRDDVELVSVCKLEEDQLNFVKEKFNIKYASTDYLEMLNMSPLDGVVIASPHFAHFENAKASLEKDCHVTKLHGLKWAGFASVSLAPVYFLSVHVYRSCGVY